MHKQILSLTPAALAEQYLAKVADTRQLLVLHELDPPLAEHLLLAHMSHMMAWLMGAYAFNPDGE